MKKSIMSIAIAVAAISTGVNASALKNEESMKAAESVISGLKSESIFQAEDLGDNNHYIRGFDGNGALILQSKTAVFFSNYQAANFISAENQNVNPIQKINLKGNAEVFKNLSGLYAKKEAKDEKDQIIVLLDPKCGYCYKLHSEEQSYLDNGYSLLYVPYAVLDNDKYGMYTSRQGLEYAYSAGSHEEKIERINEVMEYLRKNRSEKSLPSEYTSKITKKGVDAVINARKALEPLAATGTPGLLNSQGAYIGGYVPAGHIGEAIQAQLK